MELMLREAKNDTDGIKENSSLSKEESEKLITKRK
jgi:hypothetical protein